MGLLYIYIVANNFYHINSIGKCRKSQGDTQILLAKKVGKFEGRMLDLEDLPDLLYKAYKLKWFDLYTSQTDTVEYAQKDGVSIGEGS